MLRIGIAKISRAATVAVAAVLLIAFVSPATAADDVVQMDIANAMATPDAQANLDGTVKFYFGQTPYPAVLRKFGEFVSNKKANGFGRSDVRGCNRAFLDVLIQFQKRAHDLGANAVINIHSYYKKEDVTVSTTIPCHSGFLMDGIALKGEVVKVAAQ